LLPIEIFGALEKELGFKGRFGWEEVVNKIGGEKKPGFLRSWENYVVRSFRKKGAWAREKGFWDTRFMEPFRQMGLRGGFRDWKE